MFRVKFKSSKTHIFNIMVFLILNIIYYICELQKFALREVFSSNAKELFWKINDLSRITISIEYLLIICTIIFLSINIGKDKLQGSGHLNIRECFVVNISCLLSITVTSFFLSKIFAVVIGNLLQQLILPTVILVISLIYVGIRIGLLKTIKFVKER